MRRNTSPLCQALALTVPLCQDLTFTVTSDVHNSEQNSDASLVTTLHLRK